MPDAASLLSLVTTYGYLAYVAVVLIASAGAPLPISLLLIALGALSGQETGPGFFALCALGVAASVSGDALDYTLGRLGAGPLRQVAQWPRWLAGGEQAHRFFARFYRHRGLVVLVTRFMLTPFASPVSILAGASRMGLGAFLFCDALGEALYVVGNLALGRLFGARLLLQGWQSLALWALIGLLTLLPLWLARLAARQRGRLPTDVDSGEERATAQHALK